MIIFDSAALARCRQFRLYRQKYPGFLFLLIAGSRYFSDRELVALLENGLDDYVPATINEEVLGARLKAYARRISPVIDSGSCVLSAPSGLFRVDKQAMTVYVREKNNYRPLPKFTPTEFRITLLLVSSNSSVVDKQTILDRVWGERATDVNIENVDKHVESIRRKIGLYGKKLRAVYGLGYVLSE
jgi:DNA-binding response OmpR family regulator